MLSDDGHNELRDSPIPKPRPRINQVAPADAGSPITGNDVGEGTPKRKKKSGLSRLKDRKRADEVILDAAAGDAHTPEVSICAFIFDPCAYTSFSFEIEF